MNFDKSNNIMKKFRIYFATLVLASFFIFSCSKEEEEGIIDSSNQELKSVPLLFGCPDLTDNEALDGLYISAGGPENLAKHIDPKPFQLPRKPNSTSRYRKSDVVGMGTDGDSNLNFVWYKDGQYSAGASNKLDSARKPKDHCYVLPINPQTGFRYNPEDIVGMAIDGENNYVYAWYKNKFVSAGDPSDLGSRINPRSFNLARNPKTGNEFRTGQIRAIAIDGQYNLTVVFYQYRFFSVGTTRNLGYYSEYSGGQAECIEKLPTANLKTRDFLGAGIDYTNRHVLLWFEGSGE